MKITKIETNYRRNMFFHETSNLSFQSYSESIEYQVVKAYPYILYQSILGFGGAVTEASGYAIQQLSQELQEQLIKEYFGKNGIGYSIVRIPIGSCDFSLDSYSYSYENDLSDFSIEKDNKYIIPTLKMAQKHNSKVQFLASPWSPPAFMKTNHSLYHGGKLKKEYQHLWANYILKYIKLYRETNIPISFLTIQNEPNASQSWESCLYTAKEEAKFIKNYLYPTFQKHGIDTKILIWDQNKDKIIERAISTILEEDILDLIEGIAYHWYTGEHFESIEMLRKIFEDKIILHTEGCTGYSKFDSLKNIENAEFYANNILGDFSSGSNGFLDWNIVLDYHGGPNHKENYCNSPIMIQKNNKGYNKNLSFYYIGHFSKYIKPGAKRIGFTTYSEKIKGIAFKNPDNSVIIILLNTNDFNLEFNLCYQDGVFHDNLDKHTILTFIIQGA